MSELLLDRAGRRGSPATMPGFRAGRSPSNRGLHSPADPPHVEEIVAVMRAAGKGVHGQRLRGLIVILWRAGLRIQEALSLAEVDLDPRRGSLLVRHGKGGRRREVGMDAWGWQQLAPWLETRLELPVGPLFCIVSGPTRGRHWANAAARAELRRTAARAGVRRFAPHQLRHAHAVEMAREGVPLIVIQRQLGHTSLGVTSIYLQGIDSAEIIDAGRAAPRCSFPCNRAARGAGAVQCRFRERSAVAGRPTRALLVPRRSAGCLPSLLTRRDQRRIDVVAAAPTEAARDRSHREGEPGDRGTARRPRVLTGERG